MVKVLLGFMGVGKTTIAGYLGAPFLDMDRMIEDRLGMPIVDYFASHGEAAFREIESDVLAELLASEEDVFISTGGGVVIRDENRQLLRQNRRNNILLKASFETLYDRIKKDKASERPLFLNNSKEAFREIFERRMALYEDLADIIIFVDNRTPEEIARIIKCV